MEEVRQAIQAKEDADKIVRNRICGVASVLVKLLMESMSLRQIARKMKQSPTYVSMVLNNRTTVSEEFFLSLAELAYPKETAAMRSEHTKGTE